MDGAMKVIFLDIDGVLNVIGQGRDEYGQGFHRHLVENLEYVIRETGAKIVISSTWRFSGLSVMQSMWKDRGLPGEVIDVTPDCARMGEGGIWQSKERGYEIKEWLDHSPEVESYVIIDDDSDMLVEQQPFFVQTRDNRDHFGNVEGYGLTRECADRVIQILNQIK